jgi:hypothetical protein
MVNRVLLSIRSGNPAVGSARSLLVRSNPGWGRARSAGENRAWSWMATRSQTGSRQWSCLRGFLDSYRFYPHLPMLTGTRLLRD